MKLFSKILILFGSMIIEMNGMIIANPIKSIEPEIIEMITIPNI